MHSIQIRCRTCIAASNNYDSITTAPGGSKLVNDGTDKSACNGRDFQTAECRGGNCSIGKEGKAYYLKFYAFFSEYNYMEFSRNSRKCPRFYGFAACDWKKRCLEKFSLRVFWSYQMWGAL